MHVLSHLTTPYHWKQMENIGNFLDACEKYGCNKQDIFQTVDLYEAQNMPQVSWTSLIFHI